MIIFIQEQWLMVKTICVDIGILYETLDKEKVKSLSGFYVFTYEV